MVLNRNSNLRSALDHLDSKFQLHLLKEWIRDGCVLGNTILHHMLHNASLGDLWKHVKI